MQRVPELSRIEVVDEAVAAILRQKTPAQRVEMVAAANRTARALIAGRLMTDHPTWSKNEIQNEVIRRMTRGAN